MALQLCLLLGEHLFRGDCVGGVDRHILWQELVNVVDGMVCTAWHSNPAQTDSTQTKRSAHGGRGARACRLVSSEKIPILYRL